MESSFLRIKGKGFLQANHVTVPIYLYPVILSKSFKEKQSVFPLVLFYKGLCLGKRLLVLVPARPLAQQKAYL